MRTKKKKQSSNKTLPLLIIAVLIGLMAYKYRLLDEKFLKGLPDIIPTEQTSALPSSAPADALEIPVMQSRTGGQLIKRKGYTLSYNADYKTPQWVAWELTGKETKGKEERTDKFLPDPDVRGAKAYSNDYTKSGYDRGHMAPAADMKWSKQAMAESFYMSNICPQNPNLNRGDWNDLEEKSRQWAKKYGAVYIACGPVLRSTLLYQIHPCLRVVLGSSESARLIHILIVWQVIIKERPAFGNSFDGIDSPMNENTQLCL